MNPNTAVNTRIMKLAREGGVWVCERCVLDDIGLAWREVDAHVGLELVDASVDVQLPASVDDEEHLLLSVQRPLG